MFIVVGLGNPGREYARTRHNVGFDVIDVLSEKHHIQLTKNAMHGQIGEGFVGAVDPLRDGFHLLEQRHLVGIEHLELRGAALRQRHDLRRELRDAE